MSELKADNTFVFGEECLAYKKSEADKVIAEKDTKIIQLEALIENYNRISGEIIDNANHQKYKRCLAMAMWCRDVLRLMRTYEVTEDFWNLEPGQDAEYYCKKGDFYSKWRKHWLELAEKFKPNSTHQQKD